MEVEKYLSYQALSPCSNKYLQRLWDQEYYNDHRLRVLLAKPLVDDRPPRLPLHMHIKLTQLQLEERFLSRVEIENRILMERISYINRSKGHLNNWNIYTAKSLTGIGRQRELLRLSHENQAILKRIAMQKPVYDHRKWEREWRIHQGYMLHMSRYPDQWNYKKHALRYSSVFKPAYSLPKVSSWSLNMTKSAKSTMNPKSSHEFNNNARSSQTVHFSQSAKL